MAEAELEMELDRDEKKNRRVFLITTVVLDWSKSFAPVSKKKKKEREKKRGKQRGRKCELER